MPQSLRLSGPGLALHPSPGPRPQKGPLAARAAPLCFEPFSASCPAASSLLLNVVRSSWKPGRISKAHTGEKVKLLTASTAIRKAYASGFIHDPRSRCHWKTTSLRYHTVPCPRRTAECLALTSGTAEPRHRHTQLLQSNRTSGNSTRDLAHSLTHVFRNPLKANV